MSTGMMCGYGPQSWNASARTARDRVTKMIIVNRLLIFSVMRAEFLRFRPAAALPRPFALGKLRYQAQVRIEGQPLNT